MSYRFEEQFYRVKRFFDRIQDKEQIRTDYEDNLWSFFQNCWHLKDWIKNDPGVPSSVSSAIEDAVNEYESLMICADLANRSKHLKLQRVRLDATMPGRYIVATINETISAQKPSAATSVISWDYKITLQDGSECWAMDVAEQAIADWETLINKLNLCGNSLQRIEI
ncbi:MAG: hypothetical protein E3K37_17540 [Candidatus Kuenenia sp.]|nr:hypothetical protein [Candidatus Kuenenia hertensis]